MDVLINILSILGLVLLVLILAIIVIVLLVLFIPFRYGIYSEKKDNNELVAKVNVTWFFKVLNCYYYYNDKGTPKFAAKILGFTIISDEKVKPAKKEEYTPKEVADEVSDEVEKKVKKVAQETDEEIEIDLEKETKQKPKEEQESEKEIEEELKQDSKEKPKEKSKKKSLREKLYLDKVDMVIEKIKYIYHYPTRHEVQRLTIKFIKDILRKLKPKVFKIDGEIGFDSPDTTGYVIGALYASPISRLGVNLKGNFEKEIFVVEGTMKGKIKLFPLLWITGRFLTKKPIMDLIKKLI